MHAVEVGNEGSGGVEVEVEMQGDARTGAAGALEIRSARNREVQFVGLDAKPLLRLPAKGWQRQVWREAPRNRVALAVESNIPLNDRRRAHQRHRLPEILRAVDVDVLDAIAAFRVDQHEMSHRCAAGQRTPNES